MTLGRIVTTVIRYQVTTLLAANFWNMYVSICLMNCVFQLLKRWFAPKIIYNLKIYFLIWNKNNNRVKYFSTDKILTKQISSNICRIFVLSTNIFEQKWLEVVKTPTKIAMQFFNGLQMAARWKVWWKTAIPSSLLKWWILTCDMFLEKCFGCDWTLGPWYHMETGTWPVTSVSL